MKKIGIGYDNYKKFIDQNLYYVDKTLLVRDVLEKGGEATLLTRPRRFGKTLGLSMLQTFFELEYDGEGNVVDKSRYFDGMKIMECGEEIISKMGKYPVIKLSLKGAKQQDFFTSFASLRHEIILEYERHLYLKDSEKLDEREKALFRKLWLGEEEWDARTKVFRSQKERDDAAREEPLENAWKCGFYDEMVGFIRLLFESALKTNDSLEFSVITGCLRISRESIFIGMNNLNVISVRSGSFSEAFGFTESETMQMLSDYNMLDRFDEVREWYDGYLFGNQEIYNPWSVTNYFSNDGTPRAFWANTSDNEIIREIMQDLTPEVAQELTRVLQGEEIHASLDMEVIYPRLADGADTVFSFLLLAGYLTPASDPEETEIGTFTSLRIPNMEIRRVYNTEILAFMKTKTAGSVITEIERAIYLGDGNRLAKALENYMASCISYFDGSAEGFYHGMMVGLVASLSSRYYIRSNRESGEGRFDLMLEPKEKALPGIVMEFKAASGSDKTDLTELADVALEQIDDQNYVQEMKDRGVRSIIKYGIAFSGKRVGIKTAWN